MPTPIAYDTPADLARALEAAIAHVQALTDARRAGTSMVEASINLEDWAVAAADLVPEPDDAPEATTAIEQAFRAGFADGWGAKASERIYSEDEEADEAWAESGLKSTAARSGVLTQERWAMSAADLRNPAGARRDDRLLANGSITDETGADVISYSVVVDRRGQSSGVNADGTHGVTFEVRQAAESEDTLMHDDDGEYSDTAEWRNVLVDEDGAFAGYAE